MALGKSFNFSLPQFIDLLFANRDNRGQYGSVCGDSCSTWEFAAGGLYEIGRVWAAELVPGCGVSIVWRCL